MSAWSGYDQWLTTQPEWPEPPLPGDPFYPRCSRCGCFLNRDPDMNPAVSAFGRYVPARVRAEYGEYRDETGSVCAAWNILHRVCRRCGHDNTEVDA